MSDAVFTAEFATIKYVLGRKVMQIIFEVPLENGPSVNHVLGPPNPAAPPHFAIARMNAETETAQDS